MTLCMVCIGVLFVTAAMPGAPVDAVSPLITALGLAGTRQRAIACVIVMSILWSGLARFPVFATAAVWGTIIWILDAVARRIEWSHPLIELVIALVVSLAWEASIIVLNALAGIRPTLDGAAVAALMLRPVTSALLFAAFAPLWLRAANPGRFAKAGR
mgnify:CR=1 FL=1